MSNLNRHQRSSSEGAVQAASLLAESRWLQGLGRGLVCENEVDDLVQDTWLAAMKRPLIVRDSLRGWLRVVATRLAGKHYRSTSRRTDGLPPAARLAEAPAADVPAQWNELREHLRAALRDLREPYQSVIRMRYYENLTPTEIAAKTDTPVATVQIRLQRGKKLLRARMEHRYGRDWRPAMAAVLIPGHFAVPATEGARPTLVVAAGLIGCSIAAGAALWPASPTPVEISTARTIRRPDPEPAAGAIIHGPDRTTLALPGSRSAPRPTRPVTGRVVDTAGQPIAGVAIGFRPDGSRALEPLGRTDRRGHFALDCPVLEGRLDVAEGYAGLRLWPLERGAQGIRDARVVATPTATVAGILVDDAGQPIADATLRARCGQLPGFPEILDDKTFVDPVATARTDEAGRFQMVRFPIHCHATLHCEKAGFRALRISTPRHDRPLRLVLRRTPSGDFIHLTGRVRDHRGHPVPDALVGVAEFRTRSDADGSYSLRLTLPLPEAASLFAGKKGHRTTIVEDAFARLVPGRGHTTRLDLDLDPPKSIAGILTDDRGHPLPHHLVFVGDPHLLHGDLTAEGLAAGQHGPFGASSRVRSDGSFRVEGLADRDYALRVFDPASAGAVAAGRHPAGHQHARIRLHQDRFVTRRGRLVDPTGDAIADAKIHFEAMVPHGRNRAPSVDRDPVTTKADGSFTLRRIPREGGRVFVTGGASELHGEPGVVPTILDLDARALDARPFELLVPRLCHFRVHAPDAAPGSTIEFVDAYDRQVDIFALDATGSRRFDSWPLQTDITEILCTSQSARVLILRDPTGEETARTTVLLGRGLVNEIEL